MKIQDSHSCVTPCTMPFDMEIQEQNPSSGGSAIVSITGRNFNFADPRVSYKCNFKNENAYSFIGGAVTRHNTHRNTQPTIG